MRILKVVGLLALIAAACEIFLVLVAGPQSPAIPGFKYATSRQIGQELGRWLFIFLVAAISAGIAALVTRKNSHPYPGLTTGTVLAIALTAMNVIVVLQRSV